MDGKPFMILGGELDNSTGEPDYLRQFWPKLKALNLNTIVALVYWDVIEPVEVKFDFATVDGLIRGAQEAISASCCCGSVPGKTACHAMRPHG